MVLAVYQEHIELPHPKIIRLVYFLMILFDFLPAFESELIPAGIVPVEVHRDSSVLFYDVLVGE